MLIITQKALGALGTMKTKLKMKNCFYTIIFSLYFKTAGAIVTLILREHRQENHVMCSSNSNFSNPIHDFDSLFKMVLEIETNAFKN